MDFKTVCDRDSVFGTATPYGLDGSGSNPMGVKTISLLHTCPARRWYPYFDVDVGLA